MYPLQDGGEVEILENISTVQLTEFKTALVKFGLELLDDKKSILIERIKKVIVELIHYADDPVKVNFSDYLSEKLNHDYTYLANLFSEVEGINIEHYIIIHKIERHAQYRLLPATRTLTDSQLLGAVDDIKACLMLAYITI
eukprot:gene7940-8013_t